MINVQRQLLYI